METTWRRHGLPLGRPATILLALLFLVPATGLLVVGGQHWLQALLRQQAATIVGSPPGEDSSPGTRTATSTSAPSTGPSRRCPRPPKSSRRRGHPTAAAWPSGRGPRTGPRSSCCVTSSPARRPPSRRSTSTPCSRELAVARPGRRTAGSSPMPRVLGTRRRHGHIRGGGWGGLCPQKLAAASTTRCSRPRDVR